MKKLLTLTLLTTTITFSNSLAVTAKLSKKGAKVAKIFCDKSKLPQPDGTIEELMQKIEKSNACKKLNKNNLKALAIYLSNGELKDNSDAIKVPTKAKCPVCGMFVSKYPKWAAIMAVDGKHYYFDGVKDMLKFYFFDGDFKYDRSKISKFKVTSFYTLEAIDAKKAYYVIGSDVLGPMGNELIPFKTLQEAKNFMSEHKGEEILKFNQITPKIVMALDGIELK